MTQRITLFLSVLGLFGFSVGFSVGCTAGDGAREQEEVLTTEEVGGPIDAELSTVDDPRGRRRSESRRVLPPGFPAELPLPAGVEVTETARTEGKSVVVFDSPTPAEDLAVELLSLLETEGWIVDRQGALSLSAKRGEQAVWASISGSGSGSRLRIVY